MGKKEEKQKENSKEDNMNKVDGFLKEGVIQKNLHDSIVKVSNPDKQRRILETIDRRLAKRGNLQGAENRAPIPMINSL